MVTGQLLELAPQSPVLVDLFWHHWDIEPPLAQDISGLIVQEARRQLLPYRQDDSSLAEAA